MEVKPAWLPGYIAAATSILPEERLRVGIFAREPRRQSDAVPSERAIGQGVIGRRSSGLIAVQIDIRNAENRSREDIKGNSRLIDVRGVELPAFHEQPRQQICSAGEERKLIDSGQYKAMGYVEIRYGPALIQIVDVLRNAVAKIILSWIGG